MSLVPFFAPILLFFFLVAMQGWLLRGSCALCGVAPVPHYAEALGAAVVAGLLSTLFGAAWSCTFGLVLGFVIGKSVSVAVYYLLVTLVMTTVYRSMLALRGATALAVALSHQVFGAILSGVAWWLYTLAT